MHWDPGIGMGFGWLFMLVFWALVIAGIVFLIRGLLGGTKAEGKTGTAIDIL